MKLSTAKKIRSLYNSGQSVRTISRQFGISRSYCYQVLRNEVCFDVFYKPQTLKTKVDVDAAWTLMKEHKTQAQIAHELSTATSTKSCTPLLQTGNVSLLSLEVAS